MASRQRKRASAGNRAGMGVIAVVVTLLIVVLLMQSAKISRKISAFEASNASLETRIQEEKDRSEELKTLPDYVESDEYIEKAAREKFGLVYEDEKTDRWCQRHHLFVAFVFY